MMNLVMPMAGLGSRFAQVGYRVPKFLIEIHGKTLLEYSLESVPLDVVDKIYFVALEEHLRNFLVLDAIENILPAKNFEIVGLETVTKGQAQTVLAAKEGINNDNDLIIYNIDTYFHSKGLGSMLLNKEQKKDGVLGAFRARDNKWSFAQLGEDGTVVKTAEKEVISDVALTGLYHFSRGSDFVDVAEELIGNNTTTGGEFYVAPMYNELIKRGNQFVVDFCDSFIALGTPKDLDLYKQFLDEGNNIELR